MMKTFILTLKSKNIKSLNNYVTLLEKKLPGKSVCLTVINRLKKTKQFVTVLKSPHVNKTAQEQFERKKKLIQIFFISEKFNKIIIKIKKVLIKLFMDIKLTIKNITNSFFKSIQIFNIFKITNFKFNRFKKATINRCLNCLNSKKKLIEFKIYLKILINYGELK